MLGISLDIGAELFLAGSTWKGFVGLLQKDYSTLALAVTARFACMACRRLQSSLNLPGFVSEMTSVAAILVRVLAVVLLAAAYYGV